MDKHLSTQFDAELSGISTRVLEMGGLVESQVAHAVEALSGHAIGAQNRTELRRILTVAGGWSLLASLAFGLFFLLGGEQFIGLQTDIPAVRETAIAYLPYLAALPLVAVWSYLLDGLFIGATRAREMRNAMLLAVAISLPLGWLLRGLGNHGLWLAFLAFMLLRGICLGSLARTLQRRQQWFVPSHTVSAGSTATAP